MGSNIGAVEQPVHAVTISRGFWMGRFEVTQAEYQSVMGTNPSTYVGLAKPVESMTWYDALAYCALLTAQETSAGRLPTGYVYRLPTEAEWEYCCRAGSATEWSFGNGGLNCAIANYFPFPATYCIGATAPVGTYPPNAWGLQEMHGNVSELCLDTWDNLPYYSGAAVTDPLLTGGVYVIHRGGSWVYDDSFCRSACRLWDWPQGYADSQGFRIVLAPPLP
jgi:formylglycine-generating enzyme required for sulfatase activity